MGVDMDQYLDFDEEFASTPDYARMYRELGLQVVPAYMPSEQKQWKRPALSEWVKYSRDKMTDDEFEKWFGHGGKYVSRHNIGILTGSVSYGVFVLDLDTHKNPMAGIWYQSVLDEFNNGKPLETPTQTTGGGGKQMLFRAPPSWLAPTSKNSELGVDIRGEGGFAMMAPSTHETGNDYQWDDDLAPYQVPILDAPDWLVAQLTQLFGAHVAAAAPSLSQRALALVKTPTPERSEDAFGDLVDGREEKMRDMICAKIADLYREDPIQPSEARQQEIVRELFHSYVDRVETRLHEPGTPKHVLLEREGRGATLFRQKWRHLMNRWDSRVKELAAQPKKADEYGPTYDIPKEPSSDEFEVNDPERPKRRFSLLSAKQINEMPDPVFLLDGIIVEESLGFVFGVPGCLKSFIVLGLTLSVAAGLKEWMGYKINKKGPIVYITSEGLADIKWRMKAWGEMTGIDPEKLPFYLAADSMNFMRKEDVIECAHMVNDLKEELKTPPAMIIVDTLSRVIPGADENLQKDATMTVAACDYLRKRFKTAVLCVHHMSRNSETKTMRGSTVFDGAMDYGLMIEREAGAMIGTITATKIKSAPDGWTIDFEVTEVKWPVGFNETKSSLYVSRPGAAKREKVDFGGEQETGYIFVGKMKMSTDQRDAILKAAKEAWDRNDPWSMAPQNKYTARYAPRRIMSVIGKRITESKALEIASIFVDMGFWSVEICDVRKKIRGLKVAENIAQNGEWLRKSETGLQGDFRENDEENQ